MQVVTPQLIQGKKVLLRLDIDVPLGKSSIANRQSSEDEGWEVVDDFRLKAGLPTLKLCLEHAKEVVIMGHIGRPKGKEVSDLSVAPIVDWLDDQGFGSYMESGKLKILENLRFEAGEESCDLGYAKDLSFLGEVYINEAFASYHPAASTTILPTLLPCFAGLRFVMEVEALTKVRENSQKPLVAVIGGAKVEDKLPVVLALSKITDKVLVGGKIAKELSVISYQLSANVLVGELNEEGTDITQETIEDWKKIIMDAKMIVWNGPVGKIESSELRKEELGSARGTYELAKMITESGAETIVGGGDTVGFLGQSGLSKKFSFVSTGGGAMLKFLETGTLPTIKALSYPIDTKG